MTTAPKTFDVYASGALTVIGFGDRDPLDLSVPDCLEEMNELLATVNGKHLAVDLTGIRLIASGMLGMLASTANRGINVLLFNPSEDIVEVLEITNLDKLLAVYSVDVD
jgi:Anti-anti-sigma regulatory factor (antagonist of anti-sigma factor)